MIFLSAQSNGLSISKLVCSRIFLATVYSDVQIVPNGLRSSRLTVTVNLPNIARRSFWTNASCAVCSSTVRSAASSSRWSRYFADSPSVCFRPVIFSMKLTKYSIIPSSFLTEADDIETSIISPFFVT